MPNPQPEFSGALVAVRVMLDAIAASGIVPPCPTCGLQFTECQCPPPAPPPHVCDPDAGFFCRRCGSMTCTYCDCTCWHQCAECPEKHLAHDD